MIDSPKLANLNFAFRNVLRDVYEAIRRDAAPDGPRPPAFATFEDGFRAAAIVDAILESHDAGGRWTNVAY